MIGDGEGLTALSRNSLKKAEKAVRLCIERVLDLLRHLEHASHYVLARRVTP
jgi:hypothetical protein